MIFGALIGHIAGRDKISGRRLQSVKRERGLVRWLIGRKGSLAHSAICAFSKIKILIYLIHIHRQAAPLRRVIGTAP
jgi:hypothetical protein